MRRSGVISTAMFAMVHRSLDEELVQQGDGSGVDLPYIDAMMRRSMGVATRCTKARSTDAKCI